MTARACAAAAVLVTTALVAVASPSLASAAGEPQITSAGIDAQDRFYATWTLAPGTTFEGIDFSSGSILDPLLDYSDFADIDNFADFECVPPPAFCDGKPGQTSYGQDLRVSRDRRYFVVVNAKRRGSDDSLTSAMWVIDESKPQIPGSGEVADPATNTPAIGVPYVVPAPETIPAPAFTLPAPTPRTIAGFLQRGIRARVTCPLFECYAEVALEFSGSNLAFTSGSARPGGRRTFVLRPSKAQRAKLRRRSRIRVRLVAEVGQPGNKRTELVRTVTLRR
jgi:hypothetical protein